MKLGVGVVTFTVSKASLWGFAARCDSFVEVLTPCASRRALDPSSFGLAFVHFKYNGYKEVHNPFRLQFTV